MGIFTGVGEQRTAVVSECTSALASTHSVSQSVLKLQNAHTHTGKHQTEERATEKAHCKNATEKSAVHGKLKNSY